MAERDDEEQRLRSVALQNAQAVLLARRRAEEELRKQTEWLRVTLASIGDAVISTDADGRVTFLNGVAETLTGWTQAEAIGRPLHEVFRIVNERTRRPVENPALRALRAGTVVGLANDTVLIARDGTGRPIDDSAAPMRDGAGNALGAVLVFRDVTERKRDEEARARLAAIVETSEDAIVSKTVDGIIRTWNAGAERLFGYSAAEAVGRSITLFIPPERLDEERVILERLRRGQRIEHFETYRVAKDGRRVDISLTVSPLFDDAGHVVGASKIARDITERKRLEAERRGLLEQVEIDRRQLAELFQLAPAFMAVLRGPDHIIERANARYHELTGNWDILGKPVRDVFPEAEGRGYLEVLDRVYRTGAPFVGTDARILVRRAPDLPLEERFVELVYHPLRTPDADVSGILAVGIDLTERKRAEAARRESDERLRLFLENATDHAFIIIDPRGLVLAWQGGAELITGWTADEMIGKPAAILFTPAERAAGLPEAEMAQAAANGRVEDRRWHLRKDGTRFFADGVMVALRGPAGELRGFGKVFRDATEQVRTQEALARDATLLANVRDSVVVTDLDGIVTYWNEGATRLFGWTADEMVGRPYIERFPEPARAFIADQILERAVGIEWTGEYEDYRKDGSRVWIDAHVGPVRDAAGRVVGILGLAHDITDRKQAEESLREADRRKDEFLALLAHELRNPLAPLRNGLQVMKLAGADAGVVGEVRAMMERQLVHLIRLVDDLLDVSRINRNRLDLRRARILLADVISDAVEGARPAIGAGGHDLTVSLPSEPVWLDADFTRLAQVFSNVLTNSARYTPPGGRIELTAQRRGRTAVVAVRDTGIGIPEESLPRIFEMFSQVERNLERSSGGLGIGLALVKALVEMHGGTITAESQGPGKGSTFTVRLPALEPASQAAPGTRPDAPAAVRSAWRKILVVDDNTDSARSMAELLMLRGNEVRMAHDGVEAVEVAEVFRPDVILMDVGMPRLNGFDATRRIRARPWGRSVTIIALTGWGQKGDRQRSSEAGCDGHMVKPVHLPDLEMLLDTFEGGDDSENASTPPPPRAP